MSRQYLIPGSPFGGYINETGARQYILPSEVYLNDTGAAAAAALAGTASGVTTASGILTTSILLAGTSSGVTTATATTLNTGINLFGSIICVCTAGAGAAGGTEGGTLTVGSTGNTDPQSKFPQPPHYTQDGINDPAWRDWFYKINNRVQKVGQISWGQLSFLGSNLTDIQTRRHNDLQQIQGGAAGDAFHLTEVERDKVNVNDVLLWLSF